MKSLEDYYVSNYHIDNTQRHINSESSGYFLCGKGNSLFSVWKLKEYILFTNYSEVHIIPLCQKCINKLPKKLREQVIYNLIVAKLKS